MQPYIDMDPQMFFYAQTKLSDQPLTLDELSIALLNMVNDKSWGLDGFKSKFHKASWEFIKMSFLNKIYCQWIKVFSWVQNFYANMF
jgi:hypothetical protein